MDQKMGTFLAFEGIDGSGKTTQIKRLADRIRSMGLSCCETKEPTDGPVGSMVHQIMTGRIKADNRVVAALFAADRLDHLVNETDGILPLLKQGTNVLTDRYYFSSYAYHSVDMPMDWVIQLNSQCAQLLRPTATIFIDVDPEVSLERIAKNRFHTELYDTRERLTRTRQLYKEAFAKQKDVETVITLNGNQDEDALAEELWQAVKGFF